MGRETLIGSRATGFQTEAELVAAYVRYSARRNPKDVFRLELKTEDGIADIVQARLTGSAQTLRDLRMIAPRWAYALRKIPYRVVFGTENFQAFAGVSRGTALRALRTFAELGFCRKTSAQKWIKVRQPKSATRKVVAIEAKLSDWKRALRQAYRYQAFANQVWVLLDEKFSKSAKRQLQLFQRLNVGLVTLSPGQAPRKLFTPAQRSPRSELVYWYVNSMIARELRSDELAVVRTNSVKPRLKMRAKAVRV